MLDDRGATLRIWMRSGGAFVAIGSGRQAVTINRGGCRGASGQWDLSNSGCGSDRHRGQSANEFLHAMVCEKNRCVRMGRSSTEHRKFSAGSCCDDRERRLARRAPCQSGDEPIDSHGSRCASTRRRPRASRGAAGRDAPTTAAGNPAGRARACHCPQGTEGGLVVHRPPRRRGDRPRRSRIARRSIVDAGVDQAAAVAGHNVWRTYRP